MIATDAILEASLSDDSVVKNNISGGIMTIKALFTRRPYTILVPNMGGNCGAVQPAVRLFLAVCNSGLLPSAFVAVKLMSELGCLGNTEIVLVLRKGN
ncbi:pentatricopeptide repeat-containing protein [Spatholobus suberectus]|nr:pentatricopeptide repeat-containing protein [Spatholobus suberectus]